MHGEQWTDRRVVVTGGAGMIGSALVRLLLGLGCEVTVADNLTRGRAEYLPEAGEERLRFLRVDLNEPGAAEAVVEGSDTVFHLADIVAGIGFVFGNEFPIFSHNIALDRAVLDACVRLRVPNYIYAGSACSYPAELQMRADPPPLREEEAYPASPESGYGWSKLMGEYMAELAQKEGLLRVGIARFHNVFGPRCDTDPRTAQVIPSLIRKVIENDSGRLEVWGSGRQRRAFLFVDDAAETLIRVRERTMDQGPVQMGLERSTGIGELAETIVDISGRPIEIVFDTSRPEGDFDRRPDLAKAKRLLGFTPRVSLRDGLERTFRWVQSECEQGAASGRAEKGAAA